MNKIGHFDIPTTSFKKAKKFYGAIFNWQFEDVPDFEYVMIRTPEPPGGGLVEVKKMPKKGQVHLYVEVDDIDATLKLVKKNKGEVAGKKSPVGTIGFVASFESPDGCRIYLWQNAPKA